MPNPSASALLARSARLYERVKRVIPPVEWPVFAADVDAILALEARAQRRHPRAQLSDAGNLPLRRRHRRRQPGAGARGDATDAGVIVLAGVHFMAETAKLLNPEKTVLIPDRGAGCSLAASITAADVRLLRAALSRRAGRHLRQHLGGGEGRIRHLLHLGQRAEGRRIARRAARHHAARRISRARTSRAETEVEIIAWAGPLRGARALHRRRDPRTSAREHPGVVVLAHPECPPEVVAEADFAGSTAAMVGLCRAAQAGARRAA